MPAKRPTATKKASKGAKREQRNAKATHKATGKNATKMNTSGARENTKPLTPWVSHVMRYKQEHNLQLLGDAMKGARSSWLERKEDIQRRREEDVAFRALSFIQPISQQMRLPWKQKPGERRIERQAKNSCSEIKLSSEKGTVIEEFYQGKDHVELKLFETVSNVYNANRQPLTLEFYGVTNWLGQKNEQLKRYNESNWVQTRILDTETWRRERSFRLVWFEGTGESRECRGLLHIEAREVKRLHGIFAGLDYGGGLFGGGNRPGYEISWPGKYRESGKFALKVGVHAGIEPEWKMGDPDWVAQNEFIFDITNATYTDPIWNAFISLRRDFSKFCSQNKIRKEDNPYKNFENYRFFGNQIPDIHNCTFQLDMIFNSHQSNLSPLTKFERENTELKPESTSPPQMTLLFEKIRTDRKQELNKLFVDLISKLQAFKNNNTSIDNININSPVDEWSKEKRSNRDVLTLFNKGIDKTRQFIDELTQFFEQRKRQIDISTQLN